MTRKIAEEFNKELLEILGSRVNGEKKRLANDINTLFERKLFKIVLPIIEAWKNKGVAPSYHVKMQQILKENWPVLYDAIQNVLRLTRYNN